MTAARLSIEISLIAGLAAGHSSRRTAGTEYYIRYWAAILTPVLNATLIPCRPPLRLTLSHAPGHKLTLLSVAIREKEVRMVRQELQAVQQAQHSKIDKQLVKSVVLSYLSAPIGQKPEAERLLARILDLDPAPPRVWQRQDPSLAAQFVHFLETESSAPTAGPLSSSSQPVRQLAHSLLATSLRDSDRRPDPAAKQ